MADQNRFSTNSYKSQQSIEVVNNEMFAPQQNGMPMAEEAENDGPVLVQEEDLQSEVDCPGGECQLKRNSMGSVTRVSVNLSRQSSQHQHQQQYEPIVVEEDQQNDQEGKCGEQGEEEGRIQAVQNSVSQETRPVSNISMESDKNVGHGQQLARPVSLASSNNVHRPHPHHQQSMEEQKAGATESPSSGGPNVEEKMLAQIRAKRNVANLIAKFSAVNVGEEAKENGNNGGAAGNKQKTADNGGGAVNIQAMRQKFGQD